MNRYVITFSKTGTICYISHLDLMRMFQRTFKKAGIKLVYSQGFNPHPKMGFAQPLSLGYWGLKELMEFETVNEYDTEELKKMIASMMPEGIEIIDCRPLEGVRKTLAANTVAAEYIIAIPVSESCDLTVEEIRERYLGQEAIVALKKQKKKKELAEVDIKPMIRNIEFALCDETLFVTAELDSGSTSNLSPELVIDTLLKCLELDIDRSEIAVMRKNIVFDFKEF
ncbi:MAG: TIGR03936 family radical SAM-associated protein [Bacillota bacterium]|nr:TIGR03936 family radical SAM-associated protein [Bacillota bacterium]